MSADERLAAIAARRVVVQAERQGLLAQRRELALSSAPAALKQVAALVSQTGALDGILSDLDDEASLALEQKRQEEAREHRARDKGDAQAVADALALRDVKAAELDSLLEQVAVAARVMQRCTDFANQVAARRCAPFALVMTHMAPVDALVWDRLSELDALPGVADSQAMHRVGSIAAVSRVAGEQMLSRMAADAEADASAAEAAA